MTRISIIHLFLLLTSVNTHAQLQVSSALCENKINPLDAEREIPRLRH